MINRKPIDYTSQVYGLSNNTSHFGKNKINISDPSNLSTNSNSNASNSNIKSNGSFTARSSVSNNGLSTKSNLGNITARPNTTYSKTNPANTYSNSGDYLINRLENLKERIELSKSTLDSARPSTVATKQVSSINDRLDYKSKDSLFNSSTNKNQKLCRCRHF